MERAEKVMNVLSKKKFAYVLKSYINVYHKQYKTEAGENLIHLLDIVQPSDTGT